MMPVVGSADALQASRLIPDTPAPEGDERVRPWAGLAVANERVESLKSIGAGSAVRTQVTEVCPKAGTQGNSGG